jgi:hypothetical protein
MKVSKTAIFLFELMFVILIFSVSAAICTNIFAEAHQLSNESKELTMAVLEAESAAETYKADVLDGGSVLDETSSGLAWKFFDKNWNEISDERKAHYTVAMKADQVSETGLQRVQVSVNKSANDSDETIYSIEVLAYGGK